MRGVKNAEPEHIRIAASTRPDGPPATSPWPPAVLTGIERELARFVGPLAEMLVRRAAQKHHTTGALIAALLPSIESQQDRDAFSRTCARRAVMRNAPAAVAPASAPAPDLSPDLARELTPALKQALQPARTATAAIASALASSPTRASAPAQPPAITPAPAPRPVPARSPAPQGISPRAGSALLRASDALLGELPRLRALTAVADPSALQAQLLRHLSAFVADATARGVSSTHIRAARGLLCSFVDEVISASPWGAKGRWAAHALTAVELASTAPGQQDPLELLQQVLADPVSHEPLLELSYVCIALGFAGRARNTLQAQAQLDMVADRLHALLPTRRGRAGAPRTLSPHWRGLATRGHRDLAPLPLWAVAALSGALVLALWLTLNARLDARARPVFARIAAVPAALQGTSAIAANPRLASALPADASIEVRDELQRSLITLPADILFVAESARLAPRADALLARVAQALRGALMQGGEVSVIGHGDDAAPPSLQYPTGWHLTRARAQAVADVLAARRVVPARAEARAEFEPRASNTTAAGRAQNRRIEIELRLPRPEELAQ